MLAGEPRYVVEILPAVVDLVAIRPIIPHIRIGNGTACKVYGGRARVVSREARDPQLGIPAHTLSHGVPTHDPPVISQGRVVE